MNLKIILISFQNRTLTINNKIKTKRKENLHGKPGDVSAKLTFIDTESDPLDVDSTDNLNKLPNFDDDMASLDKTKFEFPQKIHFHRNVSKFVLCCIPILMIKCSQ